MKWPTTVVQTAVRVARKIMCKFKCILVLIVFRPEDKIVHLLELGRQRPDHHLFIIKGKVGFKARSLT